MPKRPADVTTAMTAARMVHARRCVLTPTPLPELHDASLTTQGAPPTMPCPQANPRPRVRRTEPVWRTVSSWRVHVEVSIRPQCPPWLRPSTTGERPDRAALRDAVRALLEELRQRAPGRSVEVRVPPFGAIQCVAGPTHTRGTPPNVIETDPVTFVLLATGRLAWADAIERGRVSASGVARTSPRTCR